MSFLKRLFGLGDSEPKARKLSHPRDLRTGDIIKFGYCDQSEVSGQQFEVSQINTYIYGDLGYPELVLKDRSGNILFLMVEEEDGDEYLAISKKVDKAKVNDLLPQDIIDKIKADGTGTKVKIDSKPDGLTEWLVNRYREVDDKVKGAYLKGDARELSDEAIQRRERFSSHVLEDSDGEHAIELAFYETGETEVSVTVYRDIDEIDEMWPRAND